MIHKVFVDDSGPRQYQTPYSHNFAEDPPPLAGYEPFWRDNYFVLCAVRVNQDGLSPINDAINALKMGYFGTHHVEIKSVWLRHPKQRKRHYLDPFAITGDRLNQFGDKFTTLISSYKDRLKLIAVVFDKRFYGDRKRKTADGNPLLKSAQIIFERLQYAGSEHVLIFDQLESSLKLSHGDHERVLGVLERNHEMKDIHVNQYDKISDVRFVKSSAENFLQVADVCAYNIHRQFVEHGRAWFGQNKTLSGSSVMPVYDYFDRIRCNFYANPANQQVRGFGLTCLPDNAKINWNLLEGCA